MRFKLMAEEKETLVFWLMPAAEERALFDSLIGDLVQWLHAPTFEPHLTLQAGGEQDENRGIELLDAVAADHAPLELDVSGIEWSDLYTKTLYVQFCPSAKAKALSDAIARGLGSASGYQFDPHLSLLYKTMPEGEKAAVAQEIRVPMARVRFDAVKLVGVPPSIEGPEDVRAWRAIAERPLTGR